MLIQMRSITSLAVFAAFLFSAPVVLAQQETAKASSADKHFLTTAATDGMAEVELGKLAAQKATNPDVKQFADRMVQDHSKANKQLMDLASTKGITVPKNVDPKHKQTIDRLSKLSGAKFDQAYMDQMVKDHNKAVSEFEKEAKSGKDKDVADFAANELSTLKDHLDTAKTINKSERKGSRE